MTSLAKKSLQQYMIQLQHNPIRTKVITAGVLSAISDIVAQKLNGIQKLQLKQLLLKVIFGASMGPLGHYFHILLEKIFKGKNDTKTIGKKVLLDQLTMSPFCTMLFMLYYGFIIERRPWVHVKLNIKKEFPMVMYTSWAFWPVVGWVSHQYVPLQLRVVILNVVGCFWGIFLNLAAASTKK